MPGLQVLEKVSTKTGQFQASRVHVGNKSTLDGIVAYLVERQRRRVAEDQRQSRSRVQAGVFARQAAGAKARHGPSGAFLALCRGMSLGEVSPCLDEETVAAFVSGAVSTRELARVEEHLTSCATCRGIVADAGHGAIESVLRALGAGKGMRDEEGRARAEGDGGSLGSGAAAASGPAPVIGGIQITGFLGRGGAATVYAGQHAMLSVPVAVKVLHDKAVEPQELERALYEARLMARLDHPNLLRVFGAGRSVDAVYIVVEYMDGGTLATAGPLGPERAFNVAQQLLSGLQALHDARILHRDIKPANCLVRRQDGRVKLGDLGIAVPFASLDDVNVVWGGTIPFMAPEVLNSDRAYSARSDLYALGMTLLWLVHGKSPIPATLSLGSWVHFGERPHAADLRPDLNPALAGLIDRMITADPRDRPGSAAEAMASLLAVRTRRRPQELHNKSVGHWLLGEVIHCADDWTAFLATHERTGATARFTRTTEGGLLESSAKKILQLAERASQLQLHGIASVLDWGQIENGAYVVTPPQGLTLEEYVITAGVCDELEAVEIGIALANALARLHSAGHVYQVVAPEKAVLSADARSAMLGWPVHCVPIGTGITEAERGAASVRFCIPDHAPPESLYRGIPITTAVDAYGLGSTLYFALTGGAPFGAYSHKEPSHDGAARKAWLRDLARVKSTAPEPLRELAPTVTQPTAGLIAELLAPNAEERPTAARACERLQPIAVQLRRRRT